MASFILVAMIWIWIIVIVLLSRMAKKNNVAGKNSASSSGSRWHTEQIPGTKTGKRPPRSTDGHVLRGIQDITCRQFGHNHPEWEEPATRYIVHDDIEDGYIILNGKKMLRTEADQYENTI